MTEAFICDAIRTPIGRYAGALAKVRTDDLGAVPIRALIARNPNIDWSKVDEVYYGCANQAGEDNRNVARMSLLLAGISSDVPGITVNRLCSSGLNAIGLASQAIKAGEVDFAIAGGVESMTRAPFVMGKAHEAFQAMLTQKLADEDPRKTTGPWAKSDGRHSARNTRRFFRHELASALAWLAEGRSDLGAFLVAAHHGKVRLSLRTRPGEEPPPGIGSPKRFAHGVHDGDPLPAVDLGSGMLVPAQKLSLACMELGGAGEGSSWADRMLGLLAEVGPFRLAYVEMLVRVADWRASQRRARKQTGDDGD